MTQHPSDVIYKSYMYRAWSNMRQRCYNPLLPNYANYGGRGITVCDAWNASFYAFSRDMGERPSPKHSLDRIDNDGNYEPSNCRWATQKVQSRNMRNTRWVSIEGQRYKVADLAEEYGLKGDLIISRTERGFSFADVVGSTRLWNPKGLKMARAARSKKLAEATHCANGHEFTPDNTYHTKEGWKRCRICIREKNARLDKDKKNATRAAWRARRRALGLPIS